LEDGVMLTVAQFGASKRAFTLLETLVVISIVALLIAILLPELSRARKQVKTTVCLSNMRGLGLAVQLYAETNADHLVTAGLSHGGTGHNEQGAWINTLQKEYGNELIARCPSDKSPRWKTPLPNGRLRRVSYAVNGYTVHRFGSTGPYDRRGLFHSPASTIYIVDLAERGEFAAADNIHPETWFIDPRRIAAQQVAIERHLGAANYNFVDGHTEHLNFKTTYSIDPSRGFPPVFVRNKYDPAIAR